MLLNVSTFFQCDRNSECRLERAKVADQLPHFPEANLE